MTTLTVGTGTVHEEAVDQQVAKPCTCRPIGGDEMCGRPGIRFVGKCACGHTRTGNICAMHRDKDKVFASSVCLICYAAGHSCRLDVIV